MISIKPIGFLVFLNVHPVFHFYIFKCCFVRQFQKLKTDRKFEKINNHFKEISYKNIRVFSFQVSQSDAAKRIH